MLKLNSFLFQIPLILGSFQEILFSEIDCDICVLSDQQGVGSHWCTENFADHHNRPTSNSVDDKGKCLY